MAIADEFDAFAKADDESRKGPMCTVCALDPETVEFLNRKHAEGVFASQLARFLRSKGHKMVDGTVSRHFRDRHDAR